MFFFEKTDWNLTPATPESCGIPSGAVAEWLDNLIEAGLPTHSIMLLRGGRVVLEKYVEPFNANRKHRMYSTTKTFVSMCIGVLIGDGKLSLDSPVCDFFPEYLPENPHPWILEMTVRDLLMMATPFNYNTYSDKDENWVKTFFNATPSYPPGSCYSYNTSGTVVLNAIVEKLSGMKLIDFLRERIGDKIGMSHDIECVERPEGGSWGGSGLLCTTRDLARFALLLGRYGNWNGEQLIPEWYVREATSYQINNAMDNGDEERCSGYGYQIWRCGHNGFATYGMGSQFSVNLPDKDVIIVTTGDTQYNNRGYLCYLQYFWKTVFDKLSDTPLPENPEGMAALEAVKQRLLPVLPGVMRQGDEVLRPVMEKRLSGKLIEFIPECNEPGMKTMRFTFDGDICKMEWENARGPHTMELGIGKYLIREFPERYYGKRIRVLSDRGYECMASCVWRSGYELEFRINAIDDYFGTLRGNLCILPDDRVTLKCTKAAEWFFDEYVGTAVGRIVNGK